jgi:hypothetical protein
MPRKAPSGRTPKQRLRRKTGRPPGDTKALLKEFERLLWGVAASVLREARYYDRDGKPIRSRATWGAKWKDRKYVRVASNELPDGKWVSTVWMGLDSSFGRGPPLIFQTSVFRRKGDFDELDERKYSTEAEALKGHKRLVKKWSGLRGPAKR